MKLSKDIAANTVSLIPETEEDRRTLTGLLEFHDEAHSLVPNGHHYTMPYEVSLPVMTGEMKTPVKVTYRIAERT